MKRKIPLLAFAATMLFACKKDVDNSIANTLTIPSTAAVAAAALPSSDFKGVNWADTRDNFADDELVLSGTTISDSYATIQTKADYI
ncbi:hypothetical protein [Chitinophaga pinensis]|uniref:Uncharacterized protein n=1 Tax=Chitinophaga pinensis TaxID=79329 RepID=A0A5C6LJV2_9BACT|nr:hypothetical protein [Chitinophaga pinensis]TWV92758.1 hypothetical protein FEF09_28085 [Chitinophaga pinensis]